MKATNYNSHLVVHVPHASTRVPDTYHSQFVISQEALISEVAESADLWTDQLAFESWCESAPKFDPVRQQYSDLI